MGAVGGQTSGFNRGLAKGPVVAQRAALGPSVFAPEDGRIVLRCPGAAQGKRGAGK